MARTIESILCFVMIAAVALMSRTASADEGMWLFTKPPNELLKQRYDFEVSPEWLEHVRKSSVRFGRGGSASIVSPQGLVVTNHHVGIGQVQKLSTAENNLLVKGFYARSMAEELPCKDLEVHILWSIEDVTDRVNEAATGAMSTAERGAAKQKRIAAITKQSNEQTGLFSEVVTLYHGGQYHLYRYKRFTDVRLVMVPEAAIAAFGGDVDNFEYPRFCLDMCFFRIYEEGRPFQSKHYLKWSSHGATDEELIFVTGHPGRTQRLFTVDHLKFLRDVSYPIILKKLWRREVQLVTACARDEEFSRVANNDLRGVQNSRKAFTGMLEGLYDPVLFHRKRRAEHALRTAVGDHPAYKQKWGDAWDQISEAYLSYATFYERHTALEGRRTVLRSSLFGHARTLLRLSQELPKPNGERLREYRDSELDSLYLQLYSTAPIYKNLEIDRLDSGLAYLAQTFGAEDSLVAAVLMDAADSPWGRARSCVRGSKLKDAAFRRKLAEGGAAAVASAGDAMIRLAEAVEPEARALRKRYEDEVESVEREAYAKIAAARFAIEGDKRYPDATFTLRLAFGKVKGPPQKRAPDLPAFTTFAGLYERLEKQGGTPPFQLPKRWIERKDRLDLATPFNMVSTADIIGGNSGSPVINRQGEVVGLVFDGNIHTLVWNVAYFDYQARAVSVDSRAIIEALRKIYDADRLVTELTGNSG